MSRTKNHLETKGTLIVKHVLVVIIGGYQKFFSPLLHQVLGVTTACRKEPSCSEYALQVINRYGIGKGFILSLRRFINCQPFFSL